MNLKNLLTLALGCAMIASPAYLAAQQDQGQESLADAARKAQAEKKNAPKPKRVFDNDNINTLSGTINVMGQAPAAPEAKDQQAAAEVKPTNKEEALWRQKFADANKKLADDQHELDILQREYNLKQQQFYTDPTAAMKQEYSRQDLNDTKAKIDEKTAAVAQDKTDLSNLEDELRKAGGDPGWANPPRASEEPAQKQ